jgi:putative flippase GtrA
MGCIFRVRDTKNVSNGQELRLTKRLGWMEWVVHHFPPGLFGRYLAVGLVNTGFGYGTYAGLTALFTPHIPFAYLLASVLANFVNITFSFFNYKWFIFKTKGNYLREWSRCVVVYGGTSLIGTALLGPLVFAIRHLTEVEKSAPYIAGALLMGFGVLASFFGHKNFSFAQSERSAEKAGSP